MIVKVLLYAFDMDTQKHKHIHFCNIENEIKDALKKRYPNCRPSDWIKAWTLQDFNPHIDIRTSKGVRELKEIIRFKYINLYPNLYISNDLSIDKLGLTNIWFKNHALEALRYGS